MRERSIIRLAARRAARALCGATMLVALFAPAATAAVEREQLDPNDDATGLVIVSPFRIEEDVQPGVRLIVEMTVTNDSDEPVDVSFIPTDVGPASNPQQVVEKIEDGEFGAGDWLTPELVDARLEPWERVTFDLYVDPPLTAPVGTNLAGLSMDTTKATGKPGTADFEGGAFRVEALIQVFLTVPGPVDHELRITDVDVRDSFVLGSQRFVVWDVTFSNRGTVNEHVSGTVDVRSIFGNSVTRERINELLVLRGSTRTTRVVWRDLPWVGAFHPEVRVRGDDARMQRANGERVLVIPWWLPVVIVLSVLLPALYMWWRRRREWRLYMGDDEDAWDDADAWDEQDTRI